MVTEWVEQIFLCGKNKLLKSLLDACAFATIFTM